MAMGMMTEYYHFIFTTLVKYLICANTFYLRWEWEVRRWRRGGRAGWVSCVSCPSRPRDTVRWDGRARAGTCQGREGWMELQVGHRPQTCGCKSPQCSSPRDTSASPRAASGPARSLGAAPAGHRCGVWFTSPSSQFDLSAATHALKMSTSVNLRGCRPPNGVWWDQFSLEPGPCLCAELGLPEEPAAAPLWATVQSCRFILHENNSS